MEQDNLVSKWLNNTFKIKSEALDLRSTPTASLSPILAPGFAPGGMTTDIQQQANNRSLFSKMNTDFWQQARGPPLMPHSLNLLNNSSPTTTPTNLSGPLTNTPSTQGSSGSPTLPGSGSLLSPSNLHHHLALMQQQHQNMPNQQSTSIQNALMNLATGNLGGGAGSNAHNNNNPNNGMNSSNNPAMNTNIDQKFDHLSNVNQLTTAQNLQMALAAQQQQNNAQNNSQTQQQQQVNTNNNNNNSNNTNNTNNNLNNQQQSSVNNNNPPPPPQSATPGGSSTPDIKMSAEKLVNEFQVSPNL